MGDAVVSHPWMPFYVGDYLRDTRRLSALEHGAYLLLIMEYWLHGEIPSDDKALARIVLLTDREWMKIRPAISKFFSAEWKHARIEAELAKADVKSLKRAHAGARGGAAKSVREASKRVANASDLPEQKPDKIIANEVASSSELTEQNPSLRSGEGAQRAAPRRATRLAPDWRPTAADILYAVSRGFSASRVEIEIEKIRNWSASSKTGAKLDWSAAWKNWILGTTPDARAGPGQTPRGQSMAEMSRMDQPDYRNDQRSDTNGAVEIISPSDAGASGFAGRLPFEASTHPGRRVVNF
jgi:uncharacterized protein YdaU (DUF1376 family)